MLLIVFGGVIVGAPAAQAVPAVAAPSTSGTDFWVTFPPNISTGALSLSIAGKTATSGTITWPDSTTATFAVTPGTVTTVDVPALVATNQFLVPKDGVANVGIRITSGADVSVYGLNYISGTSDAFVAVPTNALGSDYWAVSHKTTISSYPGRVIALATQDATIITVTPRQTYGARTAGAPYEITLNAGEAYSVTAQSSSVGANEITGTHVTSTAPIAVYASVDCGNIGAGACDLEAEQLFPSSQWGTAFVVPRLANATRAQPVRIVAATDGTGVSVDGALVATINAGEFYEATTATSGNVGMYISTSHPVQVAQFMTNGSYGSPAVTGDPSSMMIPPYQQFLSSYTVATPGTGFTFNAINVAIPTAATASLRLNGNPVSDSEFVVVAGTTFSVAQLLVAAGTHNLTADQPFGAFVYGANNYNSYAYPGGAGLSPVATVATVTITAPGSKTGVTGTQVCFPVEVKDSSNAPVAGVRVDLTASGVNPAGAGNATTDADGKASVCYTGANAGTDSVTLTSGSASTTSAVVWSAPPPVSIGFAHGATRTTNNTTPEITGTSTAAAGTTVTVTVDAATLTTVVGTDGAWTVTAPTLANGTYTVTATVTDGTTATATQALTVDTVAPSLTINGGPAATGGSILSGTSDLPAGSTITVVIDGKTVTTTVRSGGLWSLTLPKLAPGVYSAAVTATDAAGNTTTRSQSVTIPAPPGLATTGASAAEPLLAAGSLFLAGAILLLLARWRRRSA